jgi:hypothetical protein
MINNEILSFIKDQLGQGSTKDQVKDMLVTQGGWNDKDVEEAFETINFSGTSYPSVLKNAEAFAVKSEAKDEEKEKSLKSAFAPASELMKAVSNDVRPTVFSPGLSHREQPKSMEPSMPGSSFPAESAPRPQVAEPRPDPSSRMSIEPMSAISEKPLPVGVVGNSGNNALSGLRARIASGVSTGQAGESSVSVLQTQKEPLTQPVAKEPIMSFSPKPSVITPSNFSNPMMPSTPATMASNGASPRQPFVSQMTQGGGLSSLPSSGKMAMPSVMPASPMPTQQSPQPLAVFPKGPMGVGIGSRLSPTPAQLAVLQGQKQKGGGRFLLGLLMFLIGLVLGGVLMNAYMKGYINTAVIKGMDMIGLGTVTAPQEEVPVAENTSNEGS